uniref:Uncharacterized protein n=1 Tax=Arundo donax TaxID=35708 RepID=A0A0A9CFD7_ARUDO
MQVAAFHYLHGPTIAHQYIICIIRQHLSGG